jgi:hypothetical protein
VLLYSHEIKVPITRFHRTAIPIARSAASICKSNKTARDEANKERLGSLPNCEERSMHLQLNHPARDEAIYFSLKSGLLRRAQTPCHFKSFLYSSQCCRLEGARWLLRRAQILKHWALLLRSS